MIVLENIENYVLGIEEGAMKWEYIYKMKLKKILYYNESARDFIESGTNNNFYGVNSDHQHMLYVCIDNGA